MLQPVRERFIELVRTVSLQAPRIPYVSNVTGSWITAEQATDPAYWADHMCCTVRFAQGVSRLLQDTEYAFLEVGPGQALSSFVRQNPACEKERFPRVIPTLLQGYETRPDTANVLLALGKLWLAGVTPDWSALYQGERRQRLPLPTYPFERQSYWLLEKGSSGRRGLEQRARVQIARKDDVADWFYRPVWTRAPLAAQEMGVFSASPWLIFADEPGVGEQIGAQIAQQGHLVLYVRPGAHFASLDEQNFTVSPAEPGDYVRLFTMLAEKQWIPQRVVHCWQISAPSSAPQVEQFRVQQQQGFYSMLSLAKGLSPHIYDEPVQIIAFSTHMQEVTGQETLQPGKATLLGACKVISQEPLNLVCRCIDLATPSDGWKIEELVAECSSGTTDLQVAYREDGRWRQEYEPVPLPAVEAGDLPFRTQGVYLITGGLGAIGLTLAEYLARTWQARLVLLGRSGLPPMQQREDWLATHDAQDPHSQRIRRVQALEALGGQVLVYQADVSDEAQMHTLVQEVQATFGALHGVFHAAGIVDEKVFKAVQDIDREECEIHFQAKAYGTYALARALHDVELDFCLLFSSLSVVLGGLGFAAYAAANTFLDAFTRLHNRDGRLPWRSVNWDTWDVRENAHGSLGETIAAFAMRPHESIDALTRILRCPHTQLVNSTGDLPARLSQWLRTDLIVRSNTQREHVATGVPGPGNYEQTIKDIWQEVLGVKEVGLYENFFELGGNSLIALEVINKLKKAFRRPIPAVMLFEAPTISLLTKYLQPEQQPEPVVERDLLRERRENARRVTRAEGVAIIGMSGRFPGAPTVAQFWQNLSGGVESISFFSPEELEAAGIDPQVYQAPNYVPARAILAPEVVEQFDAAFFGYSPREAELTDPQHRVFLECAWEALEQAGYDTKTYEGLVGAFAGTNISTYIFRADMTKLGDVNQYQLLAGNDKDSLTSSVSYKLNLRGPSLAVQTFCSTSLVATHLACQSLLNGECDMALAGGASISVPSLGGHLYEPGGMESPDGHCRTFDAQARGSMFGDGVGVVVLKRLEDAIADGDYIQAVIKGSAINNDGSQKVSYAAPSVAGQAEVVLAALANADVPAESLSYIEAHGTATELGDPIEVASLTRAFRASTDLVGFCPIGSVKTNVGHLDRAAGISGLIKVVLSLQQEQIPPSLHFQSPNPEIDFAHSPFFVNTQLRSWPRGTTPRRAGVNSLGMGGTNAHIVLEEAPLRAPSGPSRPWQLVLLSARSAPALAQVKQRLGDFLRQQTDESIADIAYTLQRGRQRLEYRAALLCRDRSEALHLLEEQPAQVDRAERRVDRPVAFLFPGVGEQYVGMAQELYQQEKGFRTAFDTCCDLLHTLLDIDLRPLVFPPAGSGPTQGDQQPGGLDLRALLGRQNQDGQVSQAGVLHNTRIAQPLMFAVEYALAQLLLQWGIQPRAMLGYSVGEYVAACLAGVLSLEDALHLVAYRAQLISELPAGEMIAVSLPEERIAPYLSAQVNLAAVNSPAACVLAGPGEQIAHVSARLQQDGVAVRLVETTHAFHSSMLASLQEQLTAFVGTLTLNEPALPYISNVTGTWITAEQATDPTYWAQHMCQTVRFASGAGALLQEAEYLLLEVGPGQSLASFVKQHPACTRERLPLIRTTLPACAEKGSEQAALCKVLGHLWLCGVAIDWHGFYAEERRLRVPLPTYPFERKRYWIAARSAADSLAGNLLASPETVMGRLKREPLADWFYAPGWKTAAPLPKSAATRTGDATCWLFFLDACGIGEHVATRLHERGEECILVRAGQGFAQLDETHYTLHPEERADYTRLLNELGTRGKHVQHIVHLWSIGESLVDRALCYGFSSLFALAQALGDSEGEQCQLIVVSDATQNVTGDEPVVPIKATLAGPCFVLPQEYPRLQCRCIDIVVPAADSRAQSALTRQLVSEITSTESERLVALRTDRRWVPSFEAMHVESAADQSLPLRQGGVYLITGGLGGIGLAMAHFLAEEYQAKLALVGRSGLPSRDQWKQVLEDLAGDERVKQRIERIQELEALGADVLVIQADVREKEQMRSAIAQVQERFGTLHGVLHTAGVPGIGLTQFKTIEQAREVMGPKVEGTLVLDELLEASDVELLVLFSSVTARMGGGPGQIDYSAANAFLGAFAHNCSREGRQTVAIDWGEWQWNAWEAGLTGYDTQIQTFLKENRRKFGIAFAEGSDALKRVLATGLSQVIVSTQNFPALVAESKRLTAAYALEQGRALRQNQETHPRPELLDDYLPARNEKEQQIVALWEELLGILPVGINDNFFELGGNSLIGIDLIARLRKMFQLEVLAAHVLYEAPTISKMLLYLEQGTSAQDAKQRLDRGEKRRESQKQRIRQIKGRGDQQESTARVVVGGRARTRS
jgi:acyl transferase domain-containing protein/acyl carrier protein